MYGYRAFDQFMKKLVHCMSWAWRTTVNPNKSGLVGPKQYALLWYPVCTIWGRARNARTPAVYTLSRQLEARLLVADKVQNGVIEFNWIYLYIFGCTRFIASPVVMLPTIETAAPKKPTLVWWSPIMIDYPELHMYKSYYCLLILKINK